MTHTSKTETHAYFLLTYCLWVTCNISSKCNSVSHRISLQQYYSLFIIYVALLHLAHVLYYFILLYTNLSWNCLDVKCLLLSRLIAACRWQHYASSFFKQSVFVLVLYFELWCFYLFFYYLLMFVLYSYCVLLMFYPLLGTL